MCHEDNPQQPAMAMDSTQKQTVEMRSPDGSADIYQLLAGLCVACRHGFEMDNALEVAARTYVNVNIHNAENKGRLLELSSLPDSCVASAACLQERRDVFEKYDVFSPQMIDGIITQLKQFDDQNLRAEIVGNAEAIAQLARRYFHCG